MEKKNLAILFLFFALLVDSQKSSHLFSERKKSSKKNRDKKWGYKYHKNHTSSQGRGASKKITSLSEEYSYSNEDSLSSLLAPSLSTEAAHTLSKDMDINSKKKRVIPFHTKQLINHIRLNRHSLVWVHVPKTGSTFCLSMNRAECPDDFRLTCAALSSSPTSTAFREEGEVYLKQGCATTLRLEKSCAIATIKDHGPIIPELLVRAGDSSGESGGDSGGSLVSPSSTFNKFQSQVQRGKRFVMMMRQPESRVVSMFADSRHIVGFKGQARLELNEKMANFSYTRCRHIRKSKPEHTTCVEAQSFSVFIQHQASIGCVTKILTGRNCNEPVALSKAKDLSKALQIMKSQFFFIGIFEKWEESVSMFHKLRGDNEAVCEIELEHTRQRSSKSDNITEALLAVIREGREVSKSERNPRKLDQVSKLSPISPIGTVTETVPYAQIDPFDTALYFEATKIYSSYFNFY